jgi:hypothetical protein
MIRIDSAETLLSAFRPNDRTALELPEGMRFPFLIKDYVSWIEASGARVFVVFEDPVKSVPMGIAFRRDAGGAVPPAICEWCHSARADQGVGLLTATASDKRRVGVHLCRDLACKVRMEEAAETGLGPSARDRVRRVVERMSTFARQNLF